MAIKKHLRRNADIETELTKLGYKGVPTLRENLNAVQHDIALKSWNTHSIIGKRVQAKQFDGFYRYTYE